MRSIYAVVVMLGVCGTVYSQENMQQSCQVTVPPVIDGKIEDWQDDWTTDADSKFEYNVCFDEQNLYIRLGPAIP